jgi:DNA-binding NtrC family response regulator
MNQNSTILVVDDEKIARDVLKGLLINQGYNLSFATNGSEALEKARELTPDLILLDVMMPDMEGNEVCRCLRNDPILAEVPIIMITALGDERESRLRGIEAGADDFMDKSFDRIELQTRIRTITRLNRYRRFLKVNQELESKNAQLFALYDISRTLNSNVELDAILRSVNHKIKEQMNVEFTFVLFYDNEKKRFYMPLLSLETEESVFSSDQHQFSIVLNVADWVLRESSSALVQDLSTDERFNKYINTANNTSKNSIKSMICIPMQGKEHILGVIIVINKKDGEFTEEDKKMLEAISDNVAVSIEKANLYQNLQKAEMLLRRQNATLRLSIKQKYSYDNIIGNSDKLVEVLKKAEQVSFTDSTVLIYGETGTGKELLAQAIHQTSPRAHKNFVPINCGAIPKELLESELFGHEKGSFTGAVKRRIGRFEEATGGTLFLDEIGDMTLELQVRLLRILQEGTLQHLGSNENISVDVRVIAATHRNLAELVTQGMFREDLYYRLKVFELELPSLRERKTDIPLLITHFITYYNEILGKHISGIDDSAIEILYSYDYPGNIRELQHLIESVMILCKGNIITVDALPKNLQDSKLLNEKEALPVENMYIPKNKGELQIARIKAQERVEHLFLTKLLSDTNGNVAEAARKSGMNRSWLTEMINKHSLDLDQYRKAN